MPVACANLWSSMPDINNMFPIQPPLIPAYFNFFKKQSLLSQGIHKSFFLSWEDALWHLLKIHSVEKNSKILVPEFFCGDVIENMKAHGLQQVTYLVDKYLQPNEEDFIKKLKKEKPDIIIVFHAVGITNQLLQNTNVWLKFIQKEAILIEDSVHRVIDPQKIIFITENHYIIDSLRKVVPIQGSWAYSQSKIPKIVVVTNLQTIWYRSQVFFWWILMQFCLIIVNYSKNKLVKKWGNTLAEIAMKLGYDVIGDHKLPSCGNFGMAWLSSKLDIEKIYVVKEKQALLYSRLLKSELKKPYLFPIPFGDSDNRHLRGFPLGIELKFADSFLQYIRKNNILVRFELNDSDWSKKQKIVYLPMGIHITKNNIERVCAIISRYTI